MIEQSGLTGRGGAGFPTGRKLRAVADQGRRPIVVVNGLEGEPVSDKDKVFAPASPPSRPRRRDRGRERRRRPRGGDRSGARREARASRSRGSPQGTGTPRRRRARLAPPGRGPDGFVSGEETAVVSALNGGAPKPAFTPPRPYERGVGGAPRSCRTPRRWLTSH